MNKYLLALLFYAIIFLGLAFRLFGINWDDGRYMHPDERAIILSVTNLSYPQSFDDFLSEESTWNPKFFAYGSFPFYLLRISGDIAGTLDSTYSQYDGIYLIGRFLSAIFDTGTIILIYFLGKHLRGRILGLVASFFYTVSVLPIQLSHFYAVDTILTFFITATVYLLLLFYEKPTIQKAIGIGALLGCALATKISSTILISSFTLTLLLEFLLIFLKAPHKFSKWSLHITPTIKKILTYGITTIIIILLTFLILEPYALIDSVTFQKQLLEQSHMTNDAFTFPYTFQYVGKIPYLYELQNIFFYGLGPIITSLGIIGFLYALYRVVLSEEHFPWQKFIILLQFFITYFLITGSFAIGFMRYMLPLYPLMCLFAGLLIYEFLQKYSPKKNLLFVACSLLFIVFLLLFPISFLTIYSRPNTRITATEWIMKNVPRGSTIATEHWDDVVPIMGQENYTFLSLPLYEPDTKEKWDGINQTLHDSNYIIIASNRLYTPLMRLTDCQNLPSHRCYLRTSLYYKELFDGSMGFKKIAEFSSYPTIPIAKITLPDQSADESFTVYDHPKIMIFKKE